MTRYGQTENSPATGFGQDRKKAPNGRRENRPVGSATRHAVKTEIAPRDRVRAGRKKAPNEPAEKQTGRPGDTRYAARQSITPATGFGQDRKKAPNEPAEKQTGRPGDTRDAVKTEHSSPSPPRPDSGRMEKGAERTGGKTDRSACYTPDKKAYQETANPPCRKSGTAGQEAQPSNWQQNDRRKPENPASAQKNRPQKRAVRITAGTVIRPRRARLREPARSSRERDRHRESRR